MKKYFVLTLLFVLPLVTYFFFALGKHNSLFLPVISKNNKDIPSHFLDFNNKPCSLKNKITVLGFPTSDEEDLKAFLFNLNQKIYAKYGSFEDFQILMIMPKGSQATVLKVQNDIIRMSKELKQWNFVFGDKKEIKNYYESYKFKNAVDISNGTTHVYIVDKNLNLRGRKGQKIKGKTEYRESYNAQSSAELHNEMSDDVKILLREYRLALKKYNKRKDNFRDNLEIETVKNIEQNEK